MGILRDVLAWLTEAENWSGSFGIPARVIEHLWISALSVTIAAAMALPVALYIGHSRRFRLLAVTIANVGRAVPSFAILGISFGIIGGFGTIGFWPTVVALVALAIPPIVTNTYVGIQGVDADTVEAARGMGQTERQILLGIEVPLAAPLIITGLRVAAVQVVATAALGALVAGGTLGRFIVDGLAVRDFGRVGGGALLVALLALATEAIFSALERGVGRRTTGAAPRRDEAPRPIDAFGP